MLETALLIAAAHAVRARRVFEFGTFLGSTTLNLALNIPEDGRVFTLDLDADSAASLNQHPADAPLTTTHFASRMDFEGSIVGGQVSQLRGNSVSFDSSHWNGSIDLVFIDGGHDLQTVTADTENAFRLVASEHPSCVLWHDYRNPDYPDLSVYLELVASTRQVFHIEDTMLCAWFSEPLGSRLL
jgi:predicted O-methyltransferase YrrM